jgi:hypothetical protein
MFDNINKSLHYYFSIAHDLVDWAIDVILELLCAEPVMVSQVHRFHMA